VTVTLFTSFPQGCETLKFSKFFHFRSCKTILSIPYIGGGSNMNLNIYASPLNDYVFKQIFGEQRSHYIFAFFYRELEPSVRTLTPRTCCLILQCRFIHIPERQQTLDFFMQMVVATLNNIIIYRLSRDRLKKHFWSSSLKRFDH